MIPWAILCAINGDLNLGIAIIILLVIMSVIRQLLEPKLVSKNIGIHPIFTLIAMYTGFKSNRSDGAFNWTNCTYYI